MNAATMTMATALRWTTRFRTAVLPSDKPLETALLFREVTLYKRVLKCIQRTLTYVRLFRDDFTQEMLAQDEASRTAELTQKRKALSGAQKRMEELDKIIQRLYEDTVLGKLSDVRYMKLSVQYETEQAEIG